MILLDTSFLVCGLVANSPEDRALRAWLRAGEPLLMSAVAWAEFLCGPLGPAECELAERIIAERVPFAEQDAVLAAELFNDSGRRRGTLIDCMLASVALRAGAAFATRNPSDFRRLEARGLRLVNA